MRYDELSVGDFTIDMEHKNIANMIESGIRGEFEDPEIAVKVIQSVRTHFSHEEQVATEKGYLMDDDHKQEHNRLNTELDTIQNSINSKSFGTVWAMFELYNLLSDHIENFDAKLVPVADRVNVITN